MQPPSSIIHRDSKQRTFFIDVSYNADVAPDLDGVPDLKEARGTD